MSIYTLVRKSGFRHFMARLYGWGASVVILGALFKINHYPGADIMLIIGLGTEAIIFFFSGFEPPYVEPDWSLVYPELAGMYHGGEKTFQKKPVMQLDDMLKEAKIDQNLIGRLGEGLKSLSDNAAKMTDLTDASVATKEYAHNVKNASKSASDLTSSYKLAAESLQKDASLSEEYASSIKNASNSATLLVDTYKKAAEAMKSDASVTSEFTESIKVAINSANQLATQYTKSAQALASSVEKLDFTGIDGKAYNEQLHKISGSLSALNSVFELQMQSSKQQVETAGKVKASMEEFLHSMKQSSEMMNTYKDQMNALTERVSTLNSVYGGMLSAMNVATKK